MENYEIFIIWLVQALFAVLITHKILHENNIYITNKSFWNQFTSQDFEQAIKSHKVSDFPSSQQRIESPKQQSTNQPISSQRAAHSNPILVDQSEDKKRLLLLLAAFIVLLGFLAYYYFFDIERLVGERVQEITNQTEMAEGL